MGTQRPPVPRVLNTPGPHPSPPTPNFPAPLPWWDEAPLRGKATPHNTSARASDVCIHVMGLPTRATTSHRAPCYGFAPVTKSTYQPRDRYEYWPRTTLSEHCQQRYGNLVRPRARIARNPSLQTMPDSTQAAHPHSKGSDQGMHHVVPCHSLTTVNTPRPPCCNKLVIRISHQTRGASPLHCSQEPSSSAKYYVSPGSSAKYYASPGCQL